jgi:hypothetical protein
MLTNIRFTPFKGVAWLYSTTEFSNLIMNSALGAGDFYTYAYIDSNGFPYYIGKGRGRRAYRKHSNVTVTSSDKVLILKKGLDESQALKHEEYMISVIGRQCSGEGALCNKLNRGVPSHICYEKQNPDEWADALLCSVFGSKTAGCVLLFLHRNEEAHAMRIAKVFDFGLNQTQRQLRKFEQSGVLVSRMVGNVRLYSFNHRLPTVKHLRNFLDSQAPHDE